MQTITPTDMRSNIYKIIEDLQISSEPLQIKGKKGNAVIISENDFENMQETLYLLSIPKMRNSLIEGKKIPLDECLDTLNW